jgi:hypothetical protein
MQEFESTATLYVLSIKGGYYDKNGQITELLTEAEFFSSPQEAIEFREFYDPQHCVDCSMVLKLMIFISSDS